MMMRRRREREEEEEGGQPVRERRQISRRSEFGRDSGTSHVGLGAEVSKIGCLSRVAMSRLCSR